MKPSDNEIEMLAAGFAIQHKNGLIRFAHALLEKYASARAIALDASTVAGEAQPVAYLTRDEEGSPCMLFFDVVEARGYCALGEEPEPLFLHAAPRASESDFAKLQSAYVGACDQIAELLAEKQASAENDWKAAIRKFMDTAIPALAAIANVHTPDEIDALDAMPREPVIDQVRRLSQACEALSRQVRPERPKEDKDGADQAFKDLVTHGISVERIAPADFLADREQRAGDDLPAFMQSRMTPWGLLVRAGRIILGTTLMDMSKALGMRPSELSAYECDRQRLTDDVILAVMRFFDERGLCIPATAWRKAARASARAALSATQAEQGERDA